MPITTIVSSRHENIPSGVGGYQSLSPKKQKQFETYHDQLMRKISEASVYRAKLLTDMAEEGNEIARLAVKSFASNSMEYMRPLKHATTDQDYRLAEAIRIMQDELVNLPITDIGYTRESVIEFTHNTSSFPHMVGSCAEISFRSLYKNRCDTSCIEKVGFLLPDRSNCERRGTVSIVPVKAPQNAYQCLSETDCSLNDWQFGEVTRGDFCVCLYSDGFSWTWEFGDCLKYGGFTEEILGTLAMIQSDRIKGIVASLFAARNGGKAGLFGNYIVHGKQYSNILKLGETCNPRACNVGVAVWILEQHGVDFLESRDCDGQMNCETDFTIVTGSVKVANTFRKAIGNSTITKEFEVKDGSCSANASATETAALLNYEVCYMPEIRNLATDAHPIQGTYADHSFWIIPKPKAGGKNAFEFAYLQGFRTPQLFKKAGEHQTLGGASVNMGSWDCRQMKIKSMIGFGGGASYPEKAWFSNGTNSCEGIENITPCAQSCSVS